jgi:hypothetical protein
MRYSIPRLHSVRFKESGTRLRVFENRLAQQVQNKFREDVQNILASDAITGYAMVGWTRTGETCAHLHVGDGRWVGMDEAPDFVRSVLQKINC